MLENQNISKFFFKNQKQKNGNQSNQIPNRMYIDPIQQHQENVDRNIDPSSGLSSSWSSS